MIVAKYSLKIHAPEPHEDTVSLTFAEARKQELDVNLPGLLREMEENLTILLPQGYHATIEKEEAHE